MHLHTLSHTPITDTCIMNSTDTQPHSFSLNCFICVAPTSSGTMNSSAPCHVHHAQGQGNTLTGLQQILVGLMTATTEMLKHSSVNP